MKVLHTSTLDINAGGPAMSTYLTMLSLRQLGVDAQLMSYPLAKGGRLIGEGVPIHYATPPIDGKLLYSPRYISQLRALGNFDLYHAQGVWQYPTYALAHLARSCGKPYIITPRGMLYPQDIAKSSRRLKALSLRLRLMDDLNRAASVQVTCLEEMHHCRELGVSAPIAVIPNPVEIKEYAERKVDNTLRIGYLGRLSPRKNVEGLIYAFDQLGERAHGAELLIIGGGDKEYEQFLHDEVKRLRLNNIRFTGFLSGKAKSEAIASLSVLAMPSEFENLGNVVLEALVRNIPCIATKGSPWEELATHRCGWWIDYTQEALTEAVAAALTTPPTELAAMGQRGGELMAQNYSMEAIGTKFKSLYHWILTHTDKPQFVYEKM